MKRRDMPCTKVRHRSLNLILENLSDVLKTVKDRFRGSSVFGRCIVAAPYRLLVSLVELSARRECGEVT